MRWVAAKEPPAKSGEYVCKTNKGRYVVAEKKDENKFLIVKNPHYIRSTEKIECWLNEE